MSAGDYTARAAQLASSIVIVGARSAGAFGVLVEPTRLPTNPDIHKQAFAEDPKFWIDNGDKLAERWTKWSGTK